MKKVLLLFISILLVGIVVCLSVTVCFAETLEENMNGLIAKRQRYETYLTPAFFDNYNSETDVDTRTGNFSFRQTDYSLPGRNGLDVEITRLYKSGMTALYENTAYRSGSVWINQIESDWTSSDFLSFYEERYNLGSGMRFSFPTIEVVKTSSNVRYLYLHSESGAVYRMIGPVLNDNGVNEYKLEGYSLDDISIREVSDEDMAVLPSYTTNGVVNTPKYVLVEKDGTKTYFSDKDASGTNPEKYEGRILAIVDRYGNKIKFEYSSLEYVVSADKTITEAEKKTRKLITKIIDTVGREINIEYLQDANYQVTLIGKNKSDGNLNDRFNVKITTPDGKMIVYRKSNLLYHSDTKQSLRERIQWVYKLASAEDYDIDGDGLFDFNYATQLYWYWYEKADNKFNYNGSTYSKIYVPGIGSIYNTWENIVFIDYIGYKGKYIEYTDGVRKLGANGTQTYRKVSKEVDVLYTDYSIDDAEVLTYQGTDVKTLEYTYSGEPDGYAAGAITYSMIDFENEENVDLFIYTPGGSSYKWERTNTTAADGSYSLKSKSAGTSGGDRVARITVNMPVSGTLSFDYKLSCSNTAKFHVVLNNATELLSTSESGKWTHFNHELPAGNHTVYFTYTQDASNSPIIEGDDCVYLDNISISTYYSTTVKDAEETTIEYIYDGENRLVNTIEKGTDHLTTTLRYYDDNKLLRHMETTTNQVRNGEIQGIPITQNEEYVYDNYGNLIKYVGPEAPRDSDGDLNGQAITIDGITFIEGEVLYQYDIDKFHKLKKYISALNSSNVMKIEYVNDDNGNTIEEIRHHFEDSNDKSIVTVFQYDQCGNITSKNINENGDATTYSTKYEYGVIGNSGYDKLYLTRVYSGTGYNPIEDTRYRYNFDNGLQTEIIEYINSTSEKLITKYSYDIHNRVKSILFPGGGIQAYSYRDYGYKNDYNMAVEIDNLSSSTPYWVVYTYDILGNLLSTYNRFGGKMTEQYTYDSNSNLIKEIDGNGHSIRYDYNSKNHLIKKSYWENDEIEKATINIDYSYDQRDAIPISIRNTNAGDTIDYRYSMTLTDEDGYKCIYYYDLNDRLIAQELTTNNETFYMTQYKYDLLGNKIKETDANGNSITFVYDDLGRLLSKTDALGNVTTFKYNALDMLSKKVEPGGKITQYEYDIAGRLTLEKVGLADSFDKVYSYKQYEEYDCKGNVLSFKQGHTGSGKNEKIVDAHTLYMYNDRNLIESKIDWIDDDNYRWSYYEYDDAGFKTLEKVFAVDENNDGGGYIQTEYDYDCYLRNISQNTTAYYDGQNVGVSKVDLVYDDNDNIVEKREYISADAYNTKKYVYDYANRLVELKEPVGTGNSMRVSQFKYDGRGNKVEETLVLGNQELTASYEYDGMGNLVSETNALNQTKRYEYDGAGNLIIETDARYISNNLGTANGMRYTYDELNRMIKSQVYIDGELTTLEQRTYDGRNNVTGIKLGDKAIASRMVYDASDNMIQYTSADVVEKGSGNVGKIMTYDSLGNVLTIRQYTSPNASNMTTYRYYGTGQLKSVLYPDSEIEEQYIYDNTGQLFEQKTDRNGGVTKIFKSLYGTPYRTEYPDGTTESYSFDWYLGLALVCFDKKNRRREYKYDKNRNLIEERYNYASTTTQKAWKTIRYSYDEWDNLLSTETFNTLTDIDGNVTSETSLGDKVSYVYDAAFRNIRFYDETGREQTFEYDAAGNLITHAIKVDNGCDVKRYEYDAVGRLTADITLVPAAQLSDAEAYAGDSEYVDMRKLATRYTYSGTEVATKTSPRGYTTTYTYDAAYNIIAIENPHSNIVAYAYDFAGQIVSEVITDGATTSFEYDSLGRQTIKSSVAPNGQTMMWKKRYDVMGNVTNEATPSLALFGKSYSYEYDIMGRCLSKKDADGNVIEAYEYDEIGNLIKKVNAKNGAGTAKVKNLAGEEYTYDAFDRIISKSDALGNVTSYEYDLQGNVTKEINALGYSTMFTYNADKTLAQISYPDGGQVNYTYDKKGRKTSETIKQANNVTMTQLYSYTPFDTASVITDPYNNTIVNKYDGDGNVTQTTDKRGNTSYISYDGNNRIIEKKVPMASGTYQVVRYSYNGAGDIVSETIQGEQERTTTYGYTNGFLTSVSNNGGQQTLYEYDRYGNVVRIKSLRAEGVYDEVRNEYDKYGRNTAVIRVMSGDFVEVSGVSAETSTVLSRVEYKYDVMGNQVESKAPMAFISGIDNTEYTTTYIYDELNRLVQMQTVYGGETVSTTYTYDAIGNKTSVTDAKGGVTEYSYDKMNRVASITNAEGVTISYEYDLAGNKISETRPTGTWQFEYDLLNRLAVSRNPENKVIGKNIYDANGNIIRQIDGEGYANGEYGTLYEYNMANMVTSVTLPEGGTTQYEYNTFGEKTKITDPLNNSKTYCYDNAGNILSVTDELNNITSYTYDKVGNRLSVTDAKGNMTVYIYGSFGTLVSVTDAAGRSQFYKYNLTGQTTKMVDKAGNTTVYEYNSQDMMTNMTATNLEGVSRSVSYSYDCLGNRTVMADETGNYTYEYDMMQRLVSISKDGTIQLSYTYTQDGNIASVSYGGRTTSYTYDSNGRLESVCSGNIGADYEYDLSGNLKKIEYVGGTSETFVYNKNNAIVSITNKDSLGEEISSYSYIYDVCGRQISKTDPYGTTTYEYDATGRLRQAVMPGKTSIYTYDVVGNRIGLDEVFTDTKTFDKNNSIQYNQRKVAYEYSVCNELVEAKESMYTGSDVFVAGQNTIYTYDGNGNQYMTATTVVGLTDETESSDVEIDEQSETATEFSPYTDLTVNEFDGFNRLTKKTVVKDEKQVITEYAYNGDGLRTSKIVKASDDNYAIHTTNYLYDGQHVVMETGDATATYVRGMNYIAKIGASNGVDYYMYNAHGDVVQVVDSVGEVRNRYEYDPFGETILEIEETENSVMYAGEFFDESAGLYYLRARYYDPAIGRFISEDSYRGDVSNPASLNLYTYCQNDPITFIDPSGHSSKPPAWMDWNGDGKIDTKEEMDRFDSDHDNVADWNQGKGSKKDYYTSGSDRLLPNYSNAVWNRYGEVIGYNPYGAGYTDTSAAAASIYGGGAQKNQKIIAVDPYNTAEKSVMYSGMTGLANLIFDEEVAAYRNVGWYLGSDRVKVYNTLNLKKSEAYGYELYAKINGDHTGTWYTEYHQVDLYDATTGDHSVMPAWQAYGYVQSGKAYTAYQTIPENVQRRWGIAAGLRNIGIDPLGVVGTYGGEAKNYLQLITEDMPYLQVLQGAKSNSYNQSTAALQNVFAALGMQTGPAGIYDSWDMRGAVNALMDVYGTGNIYKDYTPTDREFYDRMGDVLIAIGTMSAEEKATVQSGFGNLQRYYKSSFITGQRNYERQLAMEVAIRAQEAKRQVAQQAKQQATVFYPNTTLSATPVDPYWKRSLKQVIYGNYTEDVTVLGTAGQIGASFLGVDALADIRDIAYDITHWEWSWGHAGQTVLDVVAFVPVVGAVKYGDEVGTVVKNADDLIDATKSTTKNLPEIAGRGTSNYGRQASNLKEQLAIEEAMSNPARGANLNLSGDARWPASEGWTKRAQNINGIEVHYQYNTITGEIDDFKIPTR